MNCVERSAEMVRQVMHLGMTIMATRDAVVSSRRNDLIKLEFTVGPAGFGISRLQKSTAAAAAVVVGFVRDHIDKVIFTDDGFDYETQIIRRFVAIRLSNDLTWVLHCEFDLEISVPVGIHL